MDFEYFTSISHNMNKTHEFGDYEQHTHNFPICKYYWEDMFLGFYMS